MKYLEMPIFATDEVVKIGIKEEIKEIKSHFQDIKIVDTFDYGKCLLIDGIMQTSEVDHEIYDKTILGRLKGNDERILILGGGDGYVAEMALKINPDVKITIVDLDVEVVNVCKEYLGQKVFAHPDLRLVIGDAFHYMATYNEIRSKKFDGIICDLTDNPIGGAEGEDEFKRFHGKIFEFAKSILREGGWISAQAGAAESTDKHIQSSIILEGMMRDNFGNVSREDVMIPSFSEKCSFVFGENQ